MTNNSNILLYQTSEGQIKIDVRLENETAWLSQAQMSKLFQKERSVITKHIRNIFEEGELNEELVCANFAHTTQHGAIKGKIQSQRIKLYNLDVIISVGYRVKSHQGIKFRQWATARLKEYIVKGFTMNDDLLKKSGGGNYFDELLSRIRDIRSSEKVFWRKVLDIYATSIDYDPTIEFSVLFFKTVQNKMHWAAHGHTAAEIAKNYLTKEELDILNRMVTAYLELAELQALNQEPMYMADWIDQLDSFLNLSRKDILNHAGSISHKQALEKAHSEFEKYKERTMNELSEVEKHFLDQVAKTEKELKNKTGR